MSQTVVHFGGKSVATRWTGSSNVHGWKGANAEPDWAVSSFILHESSGFSVLWSGARESFSILRRRPAQGDVSSELR